MAIKKHVGKVRSTDGRCVIVFMQLPEDKQKALIIDVEALPPRYEQLLLSVVDSQEGQSENDLASAMSRRTVQDTGNTVLTEFHRLGLMRAESIDNIILLPQPNTPFPLRDILQQMGKLNDLDVVAPTNNNAEVKYNPIVNNMNAAEEEKRKNQAMNFIAEAEMLENEANRKREQAYRLAPEIRPNPGRKVFTADVGNMAPAEAAAAVEAVKAGINEATLAPLPKKRGRKPKSATNG